MAEKSPDDIVITGYQVITPLGDVDRSWQSILEGKKGFSSIRHIFPEESNNFSRAEVAGIVSDEVFDPKNDPLIGEMSGKFDWWARAVLFGVWAGAHALARAGVLKVVDGSPVYKIVNEQTVFELSEGIQNERFGVFMGTGIGGAVELPEITKQMEKNRRVRPKQSLRIYPERVASVPSVLFQARGPYENVGSACSTGNSNIITAAAFIKAGMADVILAGSSEAAIIPEVFGAFDTIEALDKIDDPSMGSRVFDETRGGFVPAEGAGALVLESRAHAERRGAKIYAELAGYAMTADAWDAVKPDPQGIQGTRAFVEAVRMAEPKIEKDSSLYVNFHGTATEVGDPGEINLVERAVEEIEWIDRDKVYGSSTKQSIGHTIGAAGAIESAYTLKALETKQVPPTTAGQPIEETKKFHMPGIAVEVPDLDWGANNSYGFGGSNATTVFVEERE